VPCPSARARCKLTAPSTRQAKRRLLAPSFTQFLDDGADADGTRVCRESCRVRNNAPVSFDHRSPRLPEEAITIGCQFTLSSSKRIYLVVKMVG
jgi:6-phosphogluconolactonase/glucosamine-6-phosphate isomerase/deaminase